MTTMHRRDFVRGLLRSTPVAAGAAIAGAGLSKARSTADPAITSLKTGMDSLRSTLENLDERLDALEGRQKKWARIAVGAAALSLGIDVTALL